jgi:hypothetical protein
MKTATATMQAKALNQKVYMAIRDAFAMRSKASFTRLQNSSHSWLIMYMYPFMTAGMVRSIANMLGLGQQPEAALARSSIVAEDMVCFLDVCFLERRKRKNEQEMGFCQS